MSQYRNIMVVVDPAMTRSVAFERGVALARKTGAALTLLLVDYSPALRRARFIDQELLHKAQRGWIAVRQRWLDGEAAALAREGLDATAVAAWHKPPAEEIARQALERAPDLVVKDVNLQARMPMFRPADWQLMRLCPAPLMLVGAHSSSYPQRILAAVDPFNANDKPGELNDAVLRAALALAYQCDATVHVVHAYEYLPAILPAGVEGATVDPGLYASLREDHRQEFLAFGERHGIPVDRMHLLEGDPARVIGVLAEDINADLVVFGSVQRRGLKRALMGSTAEEIIGSLDSDMLVLKPADFAAALQQELREADDART